MDGAYLLLTGSTCIFRMEHSINEGDAWGDHEENDYFNDNPNARPPSPRQRIPSEYDLPPSNLPVSDGVYSSVKEQSERFVYDTPREAPLIDFSEDQTNVYDNSGDFQFSPFYFVSSTRISLRLV